MKSNIIKYIFIIFVIGIIAFAVYKIYYKEDNSVENEVSNGKETQAEVLTNMRLGISNFDNINPIISKNRDIINLSTIIYEPLMTLSEDYHLELALAKECSKINETTYIVKLKDDIKWEDSSSITGKDVQFTIEKLKEGKSIYSDNVKNVSSVEIIDGQTVRINLSKAENFFEYNLIFPIISSTQFSGEEDFFKSRIAPMSSGMYKVKSATSTTMELVQNVNWYGTSDISRRIDSIQINFYSSMGDVYNSFKIGNIDMICTSNVNIKDYIGTIGYTNKDYKGRELDFISINCNDTILANKEVRQAIDYAINKKKIISSVYSNEYYLSSFPLDYGNYLYSKESTSHYSQEKAKKVSRYAIKKETDAFDKEKLKRIVASLPEEYELRLIDREIYEICQKMEWSRFWVALYRDYEEFQKLGLGVAILKDGELVAGASSYSSYKEGIEIEIDTNEPYRRKGLATVCGARLILECLERNLYPSWDAQNLWSVALAEKLGYHYSHTYTAYEIRGY